MSGSGSIRVMMVLRWSRAGLYVMIDHSSPWRPPALIRVERLGAAGALVAAVGPEDRIGTQSTQHRVSGPARASPAPLVPAPRALRAR